MATDCTYRYWDSALTPFSGKTYSTLSASASPWAPTVLNDYDFYRGQITADPPSGTERKWKKVGFPLGPYDEAPNTVLLQWLERRHAVRPDEAVIAITGNSLTPGAWFSDSLDAQGQTVVPYTNYTGTQLYADGFDVFAPMTTHVTAFQDAQSRLASAYGDDFGSMDTRRIVAMFRHAKALGYSKIHLVGTSGGGWYSILASRALADDPALGMALAVEGWFSTQKFAETDPSKLFAPGWEASFGRDAPLSDFLSYPPNAYFAYGSCNAAAYSPDHSRLPPSRLMTYDGAHEFKHEVFQWALNRWRQDFGASAPPPPSGPMPVNDQFTKVYLPLTSDLTDSNAGGAPKTFTASGGAGVSGGALQLGSNGLTSGISTPDHPDLSLGTRDFTAEGVWQFASVAQDATQGHNLISQRGPNAFGWTFYHWNGGWEFGWSSDGSNIQSVRWAGAIGAGQDYRVKLTRSGNTLALEVNGTALGTKPISGAIFDSSAPLRIGGDGANSGGTNGTLRNFALTVDIAR